MNATVTDEHEVRTLPTLDEASIDHAAAAWVAQRLNALPDAEERAKAAGRLVTTEEKALNKVRRQRDAAACAILAHYRVRRGSDIPGALGVNRTRWKNIRDAEAARHGFTRTERDERTGKEKVVGSWEDLVAAGFDFPKVENAPKVLPKLARDSEMHAKRIEHAKVVRNAAAATLCARGMSNSEVGEIIGVDASQVSRIRNQDHVEVA